ncbi:MAG TPA: zf-TFIIB domain-containing protein [Leptolyngbyaceae cyanobacterium]
MRCPACHNNLNQLLVGDVIIDACEDGCGGIWCDRFEIKKLNQLGDSEIEELLNLAKNKKIEVVQNKKRHCPKCKNIVMQRHFFSVKKQVLVDECPKCGGYWLDAGELENIRQEFSSDKAKEVAADEYFSEVFKQYGLEKKPQPEPKQRGLRNRLF